MTTSSSAPVPVAPRPSPRSSDDFSFKELVDLIEQGLLIIRSRWYWGVLAAAIIGGLAGYALFTKPPTYTAKTALLAQSTLDKVIGAQTDAGLESRENNLRNHLSMMNSRKFRARLEKAFTGPERTLIAAYYLKPGETADADFFQEYFSSNLAIDRERGREYYTIVVTHLDPEVALMIADRVANEYLYHVQEEYREANLRGYGILAKQAEAIRNDLAQIESERLDFRKKNGIISRADNQGILAERLRRLDASLTEARIKLAGLNTVTNQARSDRARSEYPWDNAYLASFANNEVLRQELDRLTAERSVQVGKYGPNHPKMRDTDSRIKGIEASIQRNFDIAVRDLESQLDVARQTEKLLEEAFNDAFGRSIEIEKLASNYEILSVGVDSKRISLAELEKKIGEASISSKLPADFMQIVDPAYLVHPRVPTPVIHGIIVTVLALAAFIVAPIVVSLLDEKVSGTADLEKQLSLSLAGAIPTLKSRPEDRAHVVRNKLDVVTSEAFVGIVGQLEIGLGSLESKAILVTSTLPGEGKSLVASNLASMYRELGKKTVLIDLDLRRPTQHSLHNVASEKGFLNWARAGSPMNDLIGPANPLGVTKLPDGTHLIPAGGAEAHPSNFLVSAAMEQLVAQLRANYDVIVFDTPPAGVFQDAIIISRHADRSLLVAREGVATIVQARKTIEDFARAGREFAGLVLNGFRPQTANKKIAYGYKAAAKGYHYSGKTKSSGIMPAMANKSA